MDIQKIEAKWRKKWEKSNIFESEPNNKSKYFLTFPYPYINAAPHIGHSYSATRGDMMARYKRMKDYNVLFPIGLHATGEPIMGAAKRIDKKDKSQIETFILSGVPKQDIEKFKDPKKIVDFFSKTWIKDFKDFGLAVDWRRTFYTTKLNKEYSAFINWQYELLKKKELIVRGEHPVIWCPSCESPTGSHDRKEGENANILEYVLIKFKMDDYILPAATLRPETVYGVTNVWVNPEGEYVKAKIDGEKWIISEDVAKKLKNQKHDVKTNGKIMGQELIDKTCIEPINKKKIPILPASFVDLSTGTGIVMSVPAHAPYDYIALRDLNKLKEIKPITIIKTDLGENPAGKLSEKMGINSQQDPKLKVATKMVYKKEFHKGICNEKCGKFNGKQVSKMKDELVKEFEKQKIAMIFYETSEQVICRCLSKCHVRVIDDQWFIKYSDEKWKQQTLDCLKNMKIYPEEARNWLEKAIVNMKNKACARKSGLGTPLPWDKDWIIEPLSDSTIYMSYYIVSKYVNKKQISEKNMKKEFFDYVILGKGKEEEVSKKSKVKLTLLRKIRKELEYFYPVDLRNSGKDLLSHHLAFFIFHHVAIFPKKHWPKAIGANGWTTVDGEKMSKSQGNFVTLRQAINEFGADASRLALLDSNEGLADSDFRRDAARNFEYLFSKILSKIPPKPKAILKEDLLDKWLMSTTQKRIIAAEKHLENMENRGAILNSFHGIWQDLNKYMQRKQKPSPKLIRYVFDVFARINVPFTPHLSEEIWNKLGNSGFVHNQKWPVPNKNLIDIKLEEKLGIIDILVSDISSIIKIVGKKPKKIRIFIADDWKRDLMRNPSKFEKYVRKYKKIAVRIKNISNDSGKKPRVIFTGKEEIQTIESMKKYIEKQFGSRVSIEKEGNEKKSNQAMPGKPAILIS